MIMVYLPAISVSIHQWENGHLEGVGIYISSHQSTYEGMFHNGAPSGRGIYSFADKAALE